MDCFYRMKDGTCYKTDKKCMEECRMKSVVDELGECAENERQNVRDVNFIKTEVCRCLSEVALKMLPLCSVDGNLSPLMALFEAAWEYGFCSL